MLLRPGFNCNCIIMNIQKYMESGVLEDYCLGLLNERDSAFLIRMANFYPEIRSELTAVELTLEILAVAKAVKPPPQNRRNILTALGFDDDTPPDLDNLPLLTHDADYQLWLDVCKHLMPGEPTADLTVKELKSNAGLQQMLIATKTDIPDEEHGDMLESFFILKGQCICIVNDDLFHLHPGDFLQIPLYAKHNIKVLSPYVAAVLQYQFV